MRQARISGQVTVSDVYQLIIDQNLPAGERQLSFVVTVPIYEPADAQGRRVFRGWALMAIRGQDFMGATLKSISQNRLDVTLRAQDAEQALVPVAQLRSPSAAARDLHRVMSVDVGNRRWQLSVQAPSAICLVPTAVCRPP